MRMKTYRAADSSACFAQIKADLGDDAVILSNKTVKENGCSLCEIVAAIDRPVQQKQTKDNYLTEAADVIAGAGWQQEWGQIKDHLMHLMRPQMDMTRLSPRQRVAMEYLEREGVEETVLMTIYRRLAENTDLSVLPVLDEMARAQEFSPKEFKQRIHAFAGPHGAGKTSALIRLALREKKANPDMNICLAAADTQGKGRLVLKHYAELSNMTCRELLTREDFADLLRDKKEYDLILLDLPGLSGQTKLADWLVVNGLADCGDLAVHLVLSPHYSRAQYGIFSEKYACTKLASVIWTKLYEACTFGAILNMACSSGLPVSALSYGSGLKNSMTPAKREMLWRLLFKRQLPNGPVHHQ